jgi:hypothetical protein
MIMDKSKEEGLAKRGLSAKIRQAERRGADWLEKYTRHYNRRTWGILLAIFIMLGGAVSGLLLIGGLTGELEKAFSLDRITRTISGPPDENEDANSDRLTKAEFDRLVEYKAFLDSLQKSPEGRVRYLKIVSRHPGLPDSLGRIIKYYQSQIKNR